MTLVSPPFLHLFSIQNHDFPMKNMAFGITNMGCPFPTTGRDRGTAPASASAPRPGDWHRCRASQTYSGGEHFRALSDSRKNTETCNMLSHSLDCLTCNTPNVGLVMNYKSMFSFNGPPK